MSDNSTMQECPKCHERQVAEKKLIRKVYGHDTVLGKPPKKFHISGILIAGVALFIIMLRLITQAFPYNPSTRVATNPRLAIEYTIGAVCLTILFCVGLLLYQQFSYPKKIKEYEDLKNKSVEKYVCRKCGAAWDIA